jgi:hypothetical protein
MQTGANRYNATAPTISAIYQQIQTVANEYAPPLTRTRDHRLPSHGGNTGSNPVCATNLKPSYSAVEDCSERQPRRVAIRARFRHELGTLVVPRVDRRRRYPVVQRVSSGPVRLTGDDHVPRVQGRRKQRSAVELRVNGASAGDSFGASRLLCLRQ